MLTRWRSTNPILFGRKSRGYAVDENVLVNDRLELTEVKLRVCRKGDKLGAAWDNPLPRRELHRRVDVSAKMEPEEAIIESTSALNLRII